MRIAKIVSQGTRSSPLGIPCLSCMSCLIERLPKLTVCCSPQRNPELLFCDYRLLYPVPRLPDVLQGEARRVDLVARIFRQSRTPTQVARVVPHGLPPICVSKIPDTLCSTVSCYHHSSEVTNRYLACYLHCIFMSTPYYTLDTMNSINATTCPRNNGRDKRSSNEIRHRVLNHRQ